MAYPEQKEVFPLLGSGAWANGSYGAMLCSGTGVKARHICAHNYILRKVIVHLNASAAATAKPVFTIRKASEPSTVTATGTAVTGATLTVPASSAKGSVISSSKLHYAFGMGDHLVLHVSTAATKALTARAFVEFDRDWESEANTSVTTVTA
jgi:hypothetical protein